MQTSVETQLSKIRKQVEALQAKEKALLSKANSKVILQIVSLAKKNGVTAEEIVAAMGKSKSSAKAKTTRVVKKTSDQRAKVAPKYRDPANPENTWTSRGKAPLWAKALKDSGLLDTALILAE